MSLQLYVSLCCRYISVVTLLFCKAHIQRTFFFTKAYNYNQSIDSVVNRNICCKHIVLCVVT